MAIRYLIVDDEMPGRLNLRLAMAAHPEWQLLAECNGATAARAALAEHEVDVVFLDIQMPGQSGLALARDICRMSFSRQAEPPLIVFVTAYSEHAVEAFEVHALDYLLKPLDDARLAQAVERAAAMLRQRQREAYGAALRSFVDKDRNRDGNTGAHYLDTIGVRSVGRIEQVRVSDILRIESAGNYVELHLAGRTVLHRMPLGRLEGLLAPGEFLRVHRGTIVRREQIASLETRGDGTYWLTLRDGPAVAVSERYAGALKQALSQA